MVVVTLGRLGPQLRVWIDELPETAYVVTETLDRTIRADVMPLEEPRAAAIEFYRTVGPRSIYGFLGAAFIPNTSGQLTVQVALSGKDGPLLGAPLLHGDEIRIHFPYRYNAIRVLEAALGTPEIRNLGSGIVRFDHAATSAIGSAPSLDARIAEAIVRLLAGSRPYPEEELQGLIYSLGTNS